MLMSTIDQFRPKKKKMKYIYIYVFVLEGLTDRVILFIKTFIVFECADISVYIFQFQNFIPRKLRRDTSKLYKKITINDFIKASDSSVSFQLDLLKR